MKLKLASLGLLALAPLAAQAELVEMQDTELSDVKGQAYNISASFSNTFMGYSTANSFWAQSNITPDGTDPGSLPDDKNYHYAGASQTVTNTTTGSYVYWWGQGGTYYRDVTPGEGVTNKLYRLADFSFSSRKY